MRIISLIVTIAFVATQCGIGMTVQDARFGSRFGVSARRDAKISHREILARILLPPHSVKNGGKTMARQQNNALLTDTHSRLPKLEQTCLQIGKMWAGSTLGTGLAEYLRRSINLSPSLAETNCAGGSCEAASLRSEQIVLDGEAGATGDAIAQALGAQARADGEGETEETGNERRGTNDDLPAAVPPAAVPPAAVPPAAVPPAEATGRAIAGQAGGDAKANVAASEMALAADDALNEIRRAIPSGLVDDLGISILARGGRLSFKDLHRKIRLQVHQVGMVTREMPRQDNIEPLLLRQFFKKIDTDSFGPDFQIPTSAESLEHMSITSVDVELIKLELLELLYLERLRTKNHPDDDADRRALKDKLRTIRDRRLKILFSRVVHSDNPALEGLSDGQDVNILANQLLLDMALAIIKDFNTRPFNPDLLSDIYKLELLEYLKIELAAIRYMRKAADLGQTDFEVDSDGTQYHKLIEALKAIRRLEISLSQGRGERALQTHQSRNALFLLAIYCGSLIGGAFGMEAPQPIQTDDYSDDMAGVPMLAPDVVDHEVASPPATAQRDSLTVSPNRHDRVISEKSTKEMPFDEFIEEMEKESGADVASEVITYYQNCFERLTAWQDIDPARFVQKAEQGHVIAFEALEKLANEHKNTKARMALVKLKPAKLIENAKEGSAMALYAVKNLCERGNTAALEAFDYADIDPAKIIKNINEANRDKTIPALRDLLANREGAIVGSGIPDGLDILVDLIVPGCDNAVYYSILSSILSIAKDESASGDLKARALSSYKESFMKALPYMEFDPVVDNRINGQVKSVVKRAIELSVRPDMVEEKMRQIEDKYGRRPQLFLFYLSMPEVVGPLLGAYNELKANGIYIDLKFFIAASFAEGYILYGKDTANGQYSGFGTSYPIGLDRFLKVQEGLKQAGLLPGYYDRCESFGMKYVNEAGEAFPEGNFNDAQSALVAHAALLLQDRDSFLRIVRKLGYDPSQLSEDDIWCGAYLCYCSGTINAEGFVSRYGPRLAGKVPVKNVSSALFTAQWPVATARFLEDVFGEILEDIELAPKVDVVVWDRDDSGEILGKTLPHIVIEDKPSEAAKTGKATGVTASGNAASQPALLAVPAPSAAAQPAAAQPAAVPPAAETPAADRVDGVHEAIPNEVRGAVPPPSSEVNPDQPAAAAKEEATVLPATEPANAAGNWEGYREALKGLIAPFDVVQRNRPRVLAGVDLDSNAARIAREITAHRTIALSEQQRQRIIELWNEYIKLERLVHRVDNRYCGGDRLATLLFTNGAILAGNQFGDGIHTEFIPGKYGIDFLPYGLGVNTDKVDAILDHRNLVACSLELGEALNGKISIERAGIMIVFNDDTFKIEHIFGMNVPDDMYLGNPLDDMSFVPEDITRDPIAQRVRENLLSPEGLNQARLALILNRGTKKYFSGFPISGLYTSMLKDYTPFMEREVNVPDGIGAAYVSYIVVTPEIYEIYKNFPDKFPEFEGLDDKVITEDQYLQREAARINRAREIIADIESILDAASVPEVLSSATGIIPSDTAGAQARAEGESEPTPPADEPVVADDAQGAGEAGVKASANGVLPRRTVIEEFRGKRHGDVIDWDVVRDPGLNSLRNHFIKKGIKDLVFYGGVPRNAFLGLETGKDYDLALMLKIDRRTELEIKYKTLYYLLIDEGLLSREISYYMKDWSEDDFVNGRGGYPGLTELENIMRRIINVQDAGIIEAGLQLYIDRMKYMVRMEKDRLTSWFSSLLGASVEDITDTMARLYRYKEIEIRSKIYWRIAEERIGEIEDALGLERRDILDKKAFFEGRLLEIMALIDDKGNLCPRPENEVPFRRGLQLTIETMGLAVDGRLFDPCNRGMEDLEKGILRFVSESGARERMNYQNVFRLVRFHLELGFEYEERTRELLYQFFEGIQDNTSSIYLLPSLCKAEELLRAYYNLEDVMMSIRQKSESSITNEDKEQVKQAKVEFVNAYLSIDDREPFLYDLVGYEPPSRSTTYIIDKAHLMQCIEDDPLTMSKELLDIWQKPRNLNGCVSPYRRQQEMRFVFPYCLRDNFSLQVCIDFSQPDTVGEHNTLFLENYEHDVLHLGSYTSTVYLGAIKNAVDPVLATAALREVGIDRLLRLANVDLDEVEQQAYEFASQQVKAAARGAVELAAAQPAAAQPAAVPPAAEPPAEASRAAGDYEAQALAKGGDETMPAEEGLDFELFESRNGLQIVTYSRFLELYVKIIAGSFSGESIVMGILSSLLSDKVLFLTGSTNEVEDSVVLKAEIRKIVEEWESNGLSWDEIGERVLLIVRRFAALANSIIGNMTQEEVRYANGRYNDTAEILNGQDVIKEFRQLLKQACMGANILEKEEARESLISEFGFDSPNRGVKTVSHKRGPIFLFNTSEPKRYFSLQMGSAFTEKKKRPVRLIPQFRDGDLNLLVYAVDEKVPSIVGKPIGLWRWDGARFVNEMSRWARVNTIGERKVPETKTFNNLNRDLKAISEVTGIPYELLQSLASRGYIQLTNGEVGLYTADYILELASSALYADEYLLSYVAINAGLDVSTLHNIIEENRIEVGQSVERWVYGKRVYYLKFREAARIILEERLKEHFGVISSEFMGAILGISQRNAKFLLNSLPEFVGAARLWVVLDNKRRLCIKGVEELLRMTNSVKANIPQGFIAVEEAISLIGRQLSRPEGSVKGDTVIIAARELGFEVMDFRNEHRIYSMMRLAYVKKSDIPAIARRVVLLERPLALEDILEDGLYTTQRAAEALGYTNRSSIIELINRGKLRAKIQGRSNRPSYFLGRDIKIFADAKSAKLHGNAAVGAKKFSRSGTKREAAEPPSSSEAKPDQSAADAKEEAAKTILVITDSDVFYQKVQGLKKENPDIISIKLSGDGSFDIEKIKKQYNPDRVYTYLVNINDESMKIMSGLEGEGIVTAPLAVENKTADEAFAVLESL